MKQTLMQGAARYVRAENGIEFLSEAKRFGTKPLLIHGEKAYAAVQEALNAVLAEAGITPVLWKNTGFCSRNQLSKACEDAKRENCDFIMALGGGKCMDLSKAVAAALDVPVVTIPTIAATCACVTPFSVMYDDCGRPDGAIYHQRPVDLCVVDTSVLSKAPLRTLKAGMVDSLAKLPELCCGQEQETETPFLLHTARMLAHQVNDAIEPLCDATAQGQEIDLNKALDAVIALTGTCSGYAAGTKQLAMAHAFNSAARGLHPEIANNWLHGETVGVGILIQMTYNGWHEKCAQYKQMLASLGMPDNIHALGMSSEGVGAYIANHMGLAHENVEAAVEAHA